VESGETASCGRITDAPYPLPARGAHERWQAPDFVCTYVDTLWTDTNYFPIKPL
jgi:hypothetical protein